MEKASAKYQEARDLLPDNLKQDFDLLVADYKYHAWRRHGAPFVSFLILADLIMSGWRKI